MRTLSHWKTEVVDALRQLVSNLLAGVDILRDKLEMIASDVQALSKGVASDVQLEYNRAEFAVCLTCAVLEIEVSSQAEERTR